MESTDKKGVKSKIISFLTWAAIKEAVIIACKWVWDNREDIFS